MVIICKYKGLGWLYYVNMRGWYGYITYMCRVTYYVIMSGWYGYITYIRVVGMVILRDYVYTSGWYGYIT